jgi:hypothetical protein
MGVVYSDEHGIYLLSANAAAPQKLNTPGYSPLVNPVLTGDGHLLYAGDGLYLLDLLHKDTTTPLQIVSIDTQQQVIASMAISADGQAVFWSVQPRNGSGSISLYEATLTTTGASTPTQLYSQPANSCPCYMIFGLAQSGANGASTLLLTDNLGTPADQGTGLWVFSQDQQQIGEELLVSDQGQAPLTLSPDHTLLAYAPTTGVVPEPTDNSVPPQVGSQPFGNSLSVIAWKAGGKGNPTTIVPAQTTVHSFSAYHWITTPAFSPDNQSIAYIQFSSDDTGPYDRHSTLYVAPTTGHSPPVAVANFSARLVELGTWLNSQALLLYADNALYLIDPHTAAISLLAVVTTYSRIIGLVQLANDVPGYPPCPARCVG